VVTRVQYTVVDDLDASTDGVGTYRFALEGVTYEIDLSEANLTRLRDALAPFITAGRRLPKHTTAPAADTATSRAGTARLRRWWAANADTLNLPAHRPHGRIPRQVRDAYHAAH
jgi:hypothetical protein